MREIVFLSDGGPVVIVASSEYHDAIVALKGSLPSVRHYVGIGSAHPALTPFSELSSADGFIPEAAVSGDDGFVIIHTAAVGGRPRGALLSQTGMLTAQSSLVQAWRLDERDVNLGVLPLFHVAGLGLMLTVQQAGGASLIAAKFDAAQAARDIAAEKVTVMSNSRRCSAISWINCNRSSWHRWRGHGLDTPATIERFETECPNATFWAAFGQSETSGLATLFALPQPSQIRGQAAVLAQHGGRRRRRPANAGRSNRRDRRARADGVQGLLEQGSRQRRHISQWLAPHRRYGLFRYRRLSLVCRSRPGKGTDQDRRRKCLSGRGRERDTPASGDRRRRRYRRSRSAMERGDQGGVCAADIQQCDGRRDHRLRGRTNPRASKGRSTWCLSINFRRPRRATSIGLP